ncbi:MAG TPA: histidinol-phosphatase [Candidatus Limnocylindrales bacterium]|nr:histidinol-phosphatase [Candidatus Limnocylindrales bacterium]
MSSISDAELETFLAFAGRLADAARSAILPHFRQPLTVTDKAAAGASYDPVTVADRDAEHQMRALITEHYPSHGIVGEEHGDSPGSSGLRWLLDPIDGTRAFITGVPLWGTLIALSDEEGPLLGVVDQPFLRERFLGSRLGARYELPDREGTLRTRPCASLAEATLYCTHPGMFPRDPARSAFAELESRVRMSRFSGDCYSYCMVAFGLVDLVVEAGLKPWDIQAIIPIIEAAGGVVTTWKGERAVAGGKIIAAGDPAVHEQALRILQPAA